VPSFLLETYLPQREAYSEAGRQRRVSFAAELAAASGDVRLRVTIYVPEDELCFFVFDAQSKRAVTAVADRLGLSTVRVVRAESSGDAGWRDAIAQTSGRGQEEEGQGASCE
jgi:hypothetical protein